MRHIEVSFASSQSKYIIKVTHTGDKPDLMLPVKNLSVGKNMNQILFLLNHLQDNYLTEDCLYDAYANALESKDPTRQLSEAIKRNEIDHGIIKMSTDRSPSNKPNRVFIISMRQKVLSLIIQSGKLKTSPTNIPKPSPVNLICDGIDDKMILDEYRMLAYTKSYSYYKQYKDTFKNKRMTASELADHLFNNVFMDRTLIKHDGTNKFNNLVSVAYYHAIRSQLGVEIKI